MTALRKRLTSDRMGKVSITCDAWQANTADAFFAVTGHWVEKMPDGKMELCSTLLGFTQINTAHDGVQLGHALYKIVRHLGFGNKVGWITCDNASNNITMLQHFGHLLNASKTIAGKMFWDWESSHIRCLTHVINLVTQALLGAYSHTKHFNPQKPTEHEPDVDAYCRDEIGLIQSITVKARSSAKQKERLKEIQRKASIEKAKALLLDMKVRWSSTFIMLKRALELRSFLKDFIYNIAREEPDHVKQDKINSLELSDEEWKRVELMIDLLKNADNAQQAFSYESTPTLHAGIPALEALHKKWSSRASWTKYVPFSEALNAAISKIEEYYEKTATSHAYTFSMLLDPESKMSHFKKHWDSELQANIIETAEKIFKDRYLEIYGQEAPTMPSKRAGNKKLTKLMEALSESSDDEQAESSNPPLPTATTATTTPTPTPTPDSTKPWLQEFNAYIHSAEESIGEMSLLHWWGVNAAQFPVWSLLAQDHLAIMASSVSSERAFSSAGITISKRRNCLNPNILEALQFLKCLIRNELIFQEPEPCSVFEEELIPVDDDGSEDWVDVNDPQSWDLLIDDDSDD